MSSGKHDVLWRPLNEPGLEHLVLSWNETVVYADGMIIRVENGRAFRLQYRIETDTIWKVRLFSAKVWDPEPRELVMKSDGKGNWSDPKGFSIPELSGCIDVDITVTPFTNTLPIRRLKLQKSQSAELLVAYINAPELKLSAVPQRYTCIETAPNRSLYRYEGLSTGFQAELPVDEFGLVIDYPNLWARINLAQSK